MPDAYPERDLPSHLVAAAPSLATTVTHHRRSLPLRVGTRGSPLALAQTRMFLALLARFCPVLAPGFSDEQVFQEHIIRTTGDQVQDRPLADIGGKGLFSKEIHEALLDGRIDFAVHSLKDLETELPPGIVLACTLRREDARDALILGPHCLPPVPGDPLAVLPAGAVIGTNSLRRQAQLLHARPDLRMTLMRGNVQPRIAKVMRGDCAASLLAVAGLRRLGLEDQTMVALDPDAMVPSAGQGIVGITIRADDHRTARAAGGDRGPGGARRLHRRAGAAGAARRIVPDAHRWPCPAAARGAWRPAATAPDRAGRPRRWLLPVEAQPARPGRRRGPAGGGVGWQPARGQPAGHLWLIAPSRHDGRVRQRARERRVRQQLRFRPGGLTGPCRPDLHRRCP